MQLRSVLKFVARAVVLFSCLSIRVLAQASNGEQISFWGYDVARAHELKPHRRTIPVKGVRPGFDQLHLMLVISSTGDVIRADASIGTGEALDAWPQVKDEVYRWKFTPFKRDGRAVTAQIEEYVALVPPERLPTKHVAAPAIRPESKIVISLERTGCYGTCPAYTVTASTDSIVFEGRSFVKEKGKHVERVDANGLRKLAKEFVAADFYSMDPTYRSTWTDHPTYILCIDIDGHRKKVVDYDGSNVGMPAIITELEDDVDTFAHTERWISGSKALRRETR